MLLARIEVMFGVSLGVEKSSSSWFVGVALVIMVLSCEGSDSDSE